MTGRSLARLLVGFGLGALGLVAAFGPRWADAGPAARALFVAAAVAAAVGLALDVRHRRRGRAEPSA